MPVCKFCSRIIYNIGSAKSHENCCILNPNRIKRNRSPLAGAQKGCRGWSKGLTKETNSSLRLMSQKLKNQPGNFTGKKHSRETKVKLGEIARKQNLGGYRKGSGRGKKGYYKGFWCDSSWELAFVIFHLDNNSNIKRNTEKFKYIFQGHEYNFIPDFIIGETYFEIKGYVTEQVKAKLSLFPKDIELIGKDKIQPFLDYAIDKFGKDFINIYQ